jgi:hypothetical protein
MSAFSQTAGIGKTGVSLTGTGIGYLEIADACHAPPHVAQSTPEMG